MTEEALKKYRYWLDNVTDENVLTQLKGMSESEIEDCFYKDLEFGTGGMRGITFAGSNCLNVYTVAHATFGLADYLEKHGMKSVAITYDSRLQSREFSEIAAAALAQRGIRVYLTEKCMPTPFLSFAIRRLRCDAGVNVTASHNPKQYNGYKVYDGTGCQVLNQVAEEITEAITAKGVFDSPLPSFAEAVKSGLVQNTPSSLVSDYENAIIAERLTSGPLDVDVAYTPLNGAGHEITPSVLKKAQVKNLYVVPEQSYPDGNFETCPYPNPEKTEALQKVIALAQEKNADLVIANDPDSDRLGVAVKNEKGNFTVLTGNEVGILLTDFILASLAEQNKLPPRAIIVKSIVTSPMVDAVAAKYGATVTDVLTGFKYIGNEMNNLEKSGKLDSFAFGFEESCGYLKGSYARDKDGVVAAMLVCEMAAFNKKQGKTLTDKLEELYAQVGCYEQKSVSYRFDGAEGAERKNQLLRALRTNPITLIAGSAVVETEDLLASKKYPPADVLIIKLADGSKVIVRPSGTEPLIKCYLFVKGTAKENAAKLQKIVEQLDGIFK